MNTRQTAIALVIIGLLATSISTQAAPAPVFQDNFDSYTVGALPSQGEWVETPGYGGLLQLKVDPTGQGMGKVAVFGIDQIAWGTAGITLPPTFASFGPTDIGVQHARVLSFKIYSDAGFETLHPLIQLWQGRTDNQYTEDLSLRLSGIDYTETYSATDGTFYSEDYYNDAYHNTSIGGDGMTLTPATWQTVSMKIYLTDANTAKIDFSLDGVYKGTLNKAYSQSGGGFNYFGLAYYSPGGQGGFYPSTKGIYVDEIKAYGYEAPASGTLIIIQ